MSIDDADKRYETSTGDGNYPAANEFDDGDYTVEIVGIRTIPAHDAFVIELFVGPQNWDGECFLGFKTDKQAKVTGDIWKRINTLCGMKIKPSEIMADQQFRYPFTGFIFKATKKSTLKTDGSGGRFTNWTFHECVNPDKNAVVPGGPAEEIDLDKDDPYAER